MKSLREKGVSSANIVDYNEKFSDIAAAQVEKGRSVGRLLRWVTRLGRGGGWPGYQGSSAIGPLLSSSYGGALTPQVAPTTSLMAWDCHVIPTREEGDPERRQQSDYTTRNTSNCSKHARQAKDTQHDINSTT